MTKRSPWSFLISIQVCDAAKQKFSLILVMSQELKWNIISIFSSRFKHLLRLLSIASKSKRYWILNLDIESGYLTPYIPLGIVSVQSKTF